MGIHWDGTITLGTVLTIVTIICTISTAYIAFVRRIEIQVAVFATVLETHRVRLDGHDKKFDKVDERIGAVEEDTTTLVGDVQRLVGRSEVELLDRRAGVPRRGNGGGK